MSDAMPEPEPEPELVGYAQAYQRTRGPGVFVRPDARAKRQARVPGVFSGPDARVPVCVGQMRGGVGLSACVGPDGLAGATPRSFESSRAKAPQHKVRHIQQRRRNGQSSKGLMRHFCPGLAASKLLRRVDE